MVALRTGEERQRPSVTCTCTCSHAVRDALPNLPIVVLLTCSDIDNLGSGLHWKETVTVTVQYILHKLFLL